MKKKSMTKTEVLEAVETMPVAPVVIVQTVNDETGEVTHLPVSEAIEIATAEGKEELTSTTVVTVAQLRDLAAKAGINYLGRPVNPNSERQKRLAEIEAKRATGDVKRGRPANPDSASYKKRMEQEARKGQPGYVARQGRPADPNSKRQAELATKEAKRQERANQLLAMLASKGTNIEVTVAAPIEVTDEQVAVGSTEVVVVE